MAQWVFSDGTLLESGGKVSGGSALADALRQDIQEARAGDHVLVPIAPEPGGGLPLDPDQDFYLNALAYRHHVVDGQLITFTTDYREGDDVPKEARELREAHDRDYVPGRIY